MNKSKISFYFIFIAFFTFMAIFLTIVQASYNNLTNPTKLIEADKYLEPLNPVLDTEIIQEIEKRQPVNEGGKIIVNSLDPKTIENSNNEPIKSLVIPTPSNNIQPISTTKENI